MHKISPGHSHVVRKKIPFPSTNWEMLFALAVVVDQRHLRRFSRPMGI